MKLRVEPTHHLVDPEDLLSALDVEREQRVSLTVTSEFGEIIVLDATDFQVTGLVLDNDVLRYTLQFETPDNSLRVAVQYRLTPEIGAVVRPGAELVCDATYVLDRAQVVENLLVYTRKRKLHALMAK